MCNRVFQNRRLLVLLRVVRAVAGAARPPYISADQLHNSIQTMGSDYVHQITRFSNLPTALLLVVLCEICNFKAVFIKTRVQYFQLDTP